MKLVKTSFYSRIEKRFFKQHKDLLGKYADVLKKLKNNPFDSVLKTHKLQGELKEYHACSLTYKFRIIILIKIVNNEIYLINIGNHDEVY